MIFPATRRHRYPLSVIHHRARPPQYTDDIQHPGSSATCEVLDIVPVRCSDITDQNRVRTTFYSGSLAPTNMITWAQRWYPSLTADNDVRWIPLFDFSLRRRREVGRAELFVLLPFITRRLGNPHRLISPSDGSSQNMERDKRVANSFVVNDKFLD